MGHRHKNVSNWVAWRTLYGFIFTLDSHKQSCVALSTPQAEYISICETCSEIKFIRRLLAEIGFTLDKPAALYCDNIVASTWAKSSDSMGRAKKSISDIILSRNAHSLVQLNPNSLLQNKIQLMDLLSR